MTSRFTLPHIDISSSREVAPYTGTGRGGQPDARIREEHGTRLLNEINAAFAAIDEVRVDDQRLPPPTEGGFIEVELRPGANPSDVLERRSSGVRVGAVRQTPNARTVALFVPDRARPVLARILEDYANGQLTEAGRPPNANRVDAVEAFRQAHLRTLWTDEDAALPTDPRHVMWWGVWVQRENEAALEAVAQVFEARIAGCDRRLYFPEAVVIPVYASRAAIELMTFRQGLIDELRRASDNPVVFLDEAVNLQQRRIDGLADRVQWPTGDAPAVCILDTGANRAHPLLEPALSPDDQHAIDPTWNVDDHHPQGHGTSMAGIALYGDLTVPLSDNTQRTLSHRLETVKMLPPRGFDPNDPKSYGSITQSAVSRAEIAKPERDRVFCMAITNRDITGAIPSSWSAAIDQAAAGAMALDDETAPKRLFVLCAGNTPAVATAEDLRDNDAYPAEDPCQAWNALTVGAYTDRNQVRDVDYTSWSPLADVGDLSPHSRTSVLWTQGRSPIKPEVVFEGGNRAVSPSGQEILSVESLMLLTTGKDVARSPLYPFDGTSAAVAQAGRLAARLSAAYPDFWPEMIRALIVHSAEWTPAMIADLTATAGFRDRYDKVRRYGFGVPDFDRAAASASNHVALVAQSTIQPYRSQGGRSFNECHYYDLPFPAPVLEQLDNDELELKITLSYFVEPNPGFSANVDPQRYQSAGLRFDLKRRDETPEMFLRRVNAAAREDGRPPINSPDDRRWMFGPSSISAGSLHCDVWKGPAIELLSRNKLCVKPVNGWWRNRSATEIVNSSMRYALIVTLKSARIDIDLHAPISAIVAAQPIDIDV